MKEIFSIEPTSSATLWVIVAIFLVMILPLGLFGYIAWSARNVKFEVSKTEVRVRHTLYARTIPIRSIIPESPQRIDLSGESPLGLGMRVNGIGLPGFRVGWYRLRNGEKALVYLTDPQRAVYFKTSDYSVILSPTDPDGFLESLRKKIAQ